MMRKKEENVSNKEDVHEINVDNEKRSRSWVKVKHMEILPIDTGARVQIGIKCVIILDRHVIKIVY